MENSLALTSEQRENLAAYLDGELDDSLTQQIETVLATSTVARNDVELLARTYDLLDLLPRPKASGDFTEKTVAVAKLGEVRPDYRRTAWYQYSKRGVRWLGWAAILLAVSSAAYALTRYRVPLEGDLLLDNLEVIRQFERYESAGSVEFLERLGREDALLNKMKAESNRANQ